MTNKKDSLYNLLSAGDIESFSPTLSSRKFFAEKQKESDSVVNSLAQHIIGALRFIQHSNPKNLEGFNWLDIFLGKEIEAKVLFEIAKKELDLFHMRGNFLYQQIKTIKHEQKDLIQSLEDDLVEINLYIDVLSHFLSKNQSPMKEDYLDNQSRLERKLESLLALKANLSMNVEQAKLSILPITQVLDRYQETASALTTYSKYLGQYHSNSDNHALRELEHQYNLVFGGK